MARAGINTGGRIGAFLDNAAKLLLWNIIGEGVCHYRTGEGAIEKDERIKFDIDKLCDHEMATPRKLWQNEH
ncbi:hypothetical protein TWF225_002279 [Orbilia oligospora]|nr:hypothetical protein TWF225_002279 [Orbilia oligospora]KAF3240510.1 hypothetical protein TWF217_000798 [Orbilia oligospora]